MPLHFSQVSAVLVNSVHVDGTLVRMLQVKLVDEYHLLFEHEVQLKELVITVASSSTYVRHSGTIVNGMHVVCGRTSVVVVVQDSIL